MTTDDKGPWTIKAVPITVRDLATRQAKQSGLTVGEWIAMAVQLQADQDRRSAVILPGQTGQTGHVVVQPNPPSPPLDLVGLAHAVQAVTETARAAVDTPALLGLTKELAGLLRDQVRAARGLSPLGRRRVE